MKQFYIILIFAIFTSLYADVSIDQQIQNIKNAPPSKRVEMMNALKVQLSNMNSQDRSTTISKMRSKISSKSHNTNNSTNSNMQEHGRSSRGEHAQNNQSDSMHQMDSMEKMNQNHAGEEYIHETFSHDTYISNINDPTLQTPDDSHIIESNDWINR